MVNVLLQAQDRVEEPLCDWELLQRRLVVHSWTQLAYRCCCSIFSRQTTLMWLKLCRHDTSRQCCGLGSAVNSRTVYGSVYGLAMSDRMLQRLPLTAPLGEALLAGRLVAALERASAFVLAHEAASRDLRKCVSTAKDFVLHLSEQIPVPPAEVWFQYGLRLRADPRGRRARPGEVRASGPLPPKAICTSKDQSGP